MPGKKIKNNLDKPRDRAYTVLHTEEEAPPPRRKGGANIPGGTGWKVDRREAGRYIFVKKCKDKNNRLLSWLDLLFLLHGEGTREREIITGPARHSLNENDYHLPY